MRGEVVVLLVGEVPVEVGAAGGEPAVVTTRAGGDGDLPAGEADVALVGSDSLAGATDRLDVPVVAVTGEPAAALSEGAAECVRPDAPPAAVATRVRTVAERDRHERRAAEFLADPLTARTVVDGDGRILAVNDAALAFAGEERAAVLGECVWALPWADRSPGASEAYRRGVERALGGDGEVARERVAARDAAGSSRTLDALFRPLAGDRVAIEARDVGMLVDEGAAIEPPSRRLRTIVDNLPIVLFALDDDGRFTLSEGRGLERLGLEPGEVVGDSVFDVYGDADAVVDAAERALDGEAVTVTTEAGGRVWETWFRPVGDDGVRSVLGAAIDVTERERRERELQQYETIVETVPDGVFVLDEHGTILECNGTAAAMLGYDREQLEGELFERLVDRGVVDASAVDRYVDVVRELLSSDSARERGRLEFEAALPDGDDRVLEVHVALRPHDGDYRGTIGVVRDVTERRERERQLRRQNERLEEFASAVSHDLRNPLSVARGTADLLAEDAGTDAGDADADPGGADAEALDRLRRSLRRMDELVEDLLELARTGQTVTAPAAVDLAAVADDAWATVAATDATLAVRTDAVVEADRSRLRQLLENLFRNAVEHAGDAPRVEVGDLEGGRGFYVADDGPGIPEGERDRVLEHGYTTAEGGTGFGLAIVRSVAAAHGWTLSVEESDAGGARIVVAGVDPAG